MDITELKEKINAGALDEKLTELYGADALDKQRERYFSACEAFSETFPERREVSVYSAPGRTEICGNHTDHQHGCILAAAVDLDVIAIVSFHDEGIIRLRSKGYPMSEVKLDSLEPAESEKETSEALIRGVAAGYERLGVKVGGFDAYTASDVLSGSGLSSSAAFEVLLGTIIDTRCNDGKAGPVEAAKIGQYAENVFFGKKSGLMDQTVSAVGSAVAIDFCDTSDPKVKAASFDLDKSGLALFITDTKGSHADLSDDYSSVPTEMFAVAKRLGKEYLRAADENEFYARLPELRKSCGDRAVLRAAHFFDENRRAAEAAKALEEGDTELFLSTIKASGNSSAKWLQNLYSPRFPDNQGITVALLVSERALAGKGAVRVHGGGFAGTIQAFVPTDLAEDYRKAMDALFGEGSCHRLRIRNAGGIKIV